MTLLRCNNKSGQITPFLVLVIAVLILTIPATFIIGEATFQRIRLANVADNALISAASGFCRGLNQIKQISFGPGGLLVTYIGLQTFLLMKWSKCPCACPPGNAMTQWGWFPKGMPLATGFYINSMLTSKRLYDEAKKISEKMPKQMRIALWDRALGGGLVDEPKPYIDIPNGNTYLEYNPDDSGTWDEISRDPEPNGMVVYINYDKFLDRDSQFAKQLREYKKANPATWYHQNTYSYTYNTTKETVVPEGTPLGETTGKLAAGEPSCSSCEGYFRAEADGLPNSVTPQPQIMLLNYWYLQPKYYTCCPPYWCCCCYCAVLPAFIPHPYAWIRKIDIDSTSFGLNLRKLVSFNRVPFFGTRPSSSEEPGQPRTPTFEQSSRIRLQGSVWSGYEPKMEE